MEIAVSETIPPACQGPSWMIGARTFLMERVSPECEKILIPERVTHGVKVRWRYGDLAQVTPDIPRRARLLHRLRPSPRRRIAQGLAFEGRRNAPNNWAHFLDDLLPLYFHTCAQLQLAEGEMTLLLPADAPGHIRAATEIFGIPALFTSDLFAGRCVIAECVYDIERKADGTEGPWRRLPYVLQVLPSRVSWAQLPLPQRKLREAFSATPAVLPKRVFLARRKTRAVSNMAEIAPVLARFGFKTVYPEDLSALDQIRLFQDTEVMLAVHGAGLAPLSYRGPDSALQTLVEILPCGHMSTNFRDIAAEVGVNWVGIRGRLKPEYVKPAQDMTKRGFVEFSLDNFEVDPASLQEALDLAGVQPAPTLS